MKKLLLSAACYCLHFLGSAQGLSQKIAPDDSHYISQAAMSSAYGRAQRHFKSTYPGISDAQWSTVSGGGFVCQSEQPEMVTRAHYDRRGNWICTVSGYESSILPEGVKETVRHCFEGYRVTFVNQVTSKAVIPVYFINLEGWSDIKVIRIIGDEIEVIRAMEKK